MWTHMLSRTFRGTFSNGRDVLFMEISTLDFTNTVRYLAWHSYRTNWCSGPNVDAKHFWKEEGRVALGFSGGRLCRFSAPCDCSLISPRYTAQNSGCGDCLLHSLWLLPSQSKLHSTEFRLWRLFAQLLVTVATPVHATQHRIQVAETLCSTNSLSRLDCRRISAQNSGCGDCLLHSLRLSPHQPALHSTEFRLWRLFAPLLATVASSARAT
jgi:hypothetical protein